MNRELLYRFFLCRTDAAEERTIADWLDRSPDNFDKFTELRREFEAMVIHAQDAAPVRRRPVRRLVRRISIGAAAAAAVALLLVAGSHFLAGVKLDKQLGGMKRMALRVPAGQRVNLTLQDGTTVWLNSGSSIEYPALFSKKNRRVSIEGEAVFDVEPDPSRPFIVETFACDVEVLGTRFDVMSDSVRGIFSAAVFHGRVKATNRLTSGEHYILAANDQVWLSGRRLVAGRLSDSDKYLWTEGFISVRGLSFEELMCRFEKDFGVKIVIERTSMPVINYNYGKIRISDGVDFALRMLQLGTAFDYSRDEQDGTIIIR